MPDGGQAVILHASAVAVGGRGVLILGRSGAGKSALALALIGRGATLVADDRVELTRRDDALIARCPSEAIRGLIEARGFGLLRLPTVPEVPVTLAVDLDRAPSARMPQSVTITHLGREVELISGREVPNLDLILSFYVQNGASRE